MKGGVFPKSAPSQPLRLQFGDLPAAQNLTSDNGTETAGIRTPPPRKKFQTLSCLFSILRRYLCRRRMFCFWRLCHSGTFGCEESVRSAEVASGWVASEQ